MRHWGLRQFVMSPLNRLEDCTGSVLFSLSVWNKQRAEQRYWALDWLWKLDSTAAGGLWRETSCLGCVLHLNSVWLTDYSLHSPRSTTAPARCSQKITEVIFFQTKRDICSVLKSHEPIFVPVFLESFCPVCSACRFPQQHSGRSPSFPEAPLSRPTNGITMVCYCLPWPRHSLTRIVALSQFPLLSSIWRSSDERKKSPVFLPGYLIYRFGNDRVVQYWHRPVWHMAACCLWGLHRNDSWVVQIKPKRTTDFSALISNRLVMRDEFRCQEGWSQSVSQKRCYSERLVSRTLRTKFTSTLQALKETCCKPPRK